MHGIDKASSLAGGQPVVGPAFDNLPPVLPHLFLQGVDVGAMDVPMIVHLVHRLPGPHPAGEYTLPLRVDCRDHIGYLRQKSVEVLGRLPGREAPQDRGRGQGARGGQRKPARLIVPPFCDEVVLEFVLDDVHLRSCPDSLMGCARAWHEEGPVERKLCRADEAEGEDDLRIFGEWIELNLGE